MKQQQQQSSTNFITLRSRIATGQGDKFNEQLLKGLLLQQHNNQKKDPLSANQRVFMLLTITKRIY